MITGVSLGALAAGCLASLSMATSVQAQGLLTHDQEPAAAPIAQTDAGDAIVVTARRRSEDVGKVPTTVSAIGSEGLQARGISTQSDLQASVPGLTVRETQANNNLNYAIRGQTVDAFSGSSTAVVPYVNEVPFTAGGVASFFDLESIQVLKGPQGTLFGRNATGGAVLSTTARPKDGVSAAIRLGFGNYDAKIAEAMVNLPIAEDTVLLRLAGKAARRGGYIRNVYQGPVYGGNDNTELGKLYSDAVRASLLVRPTTSVENLTVLQYEKTKGNNSGTRIYSLYRCGDKAADGAPLSCFSAFVFPTLPAVLQRQQTQLGFWEVEGDAPSFHRGEDWFVTNSTTIELSDETRLKNIFGYSSSNALDSTEQTGDPFEVVTNYDRSRPIGSSLRSYGNEVTYKSLSNELQLQGKIAGAFDYIVGLYYQQIKNRTIFPQTYLGGAVTTTSNWQSKDTTKALFGHVTTDLGQVADLHGLKLSMGGRYASEKITAEHLPGGTYFPLAVAPFEDDRASWNVGLEYQANRALMLYGTMRESWRSGGFNGVSPPFLIDGTVFPNVTYSNTDKFKSEVATDIEIGAKYSGRLWNAPIHAYVSAYTMKVKNVQRVLFVDNPFTSVADNVPNTVNVPEARIRGLEVDVGVRPFEFLDLGVNGAYTDAKFRKNSVTVWGNTPSSQSFKFGPFADTPEWTGSLYAVINIPLPKSGGTFKIRADMYSQSSFYFSNLNDTVVPGTKLPGYEVANFRLDWQGVLGTKLDLGAWVKNAFNEQYYVGGLPLGGSLGINSGNVGRPRMFGFDLSYRFGPN